MRLRATCCGSRAVFIAPNPPAARISGYSIRKPRIERISESWNTEISRATSRPATAMITIRKSQPATHSAARVLDCVRSIREACEVGAGRYRRARHNLQCAIAMRGVAISLWERLPVGAKERRTLSVIPGRCEASNPESRHSGSGPPDHLGMTKEEDLRMRILQPAEWSKPRGFSHGVEVDAPGKWIVLAGQTGGDEKGDYTPDMAAQVGTALKRIIKLLGEAGAGPEHIVRLTWYLTSRSDYEAAGPGIGAAWKETLGRNFPPSTLLYIDGLVDGRAKVEIEVTAFIPAA